MVVIQISNKVAGAMVFGGLLVQLFAGPVFAGPGLVSHVRQVAPLRQDSVRMPSAADLPKEAPQTSLAPAPANVPGAMDPASPMAVPPVGGYDPAGRRDPFSPVLSQLAPGQVDPTLPPLQRVNLTDYLQERVGDLEEAAIETPVPGLRLILGALGEVSAAQTTATQRGQLMEAIRKLKADVVILDLAAGMNRSTIDFFVQADEHLLVTTPEPTAIENAYGFLRAALHRRMSLAMTESPIRDLLREALAKRGIVPAAARKGRKGQG